VEAESAPSSDVPRAYLVAWELLEFTRAALTSLEDGATRVAAAQVAGLIALWTQLSTFEDGPPQILAWTAWVILIIGVASLGPLVTPRRLAKFWKSLPVDDILAVDRLEKEERLIRDLYQTMQGQLNRLRRGMTVSIGLGLVALVIAAIAFVVEKTAYPP
jgi:hypothetical protein